MTLSTFRSCFIVLATISCISLNVTAGEMPRLVSKDGRHELLVDGNPFFILGAQMNNSSDWPAFLPQVWAAIDDIHANTLEAPVYWQQVERHEGKFNFSDLDTLISQARKHNVRLVLLWFGSWKNGSMNYAPDWVKLDTACFPREWDAKDQPQTILSVFSKATLDADRRAFVALMQHLKETDGTRHTVIMVQVENETGTWGFTRDHSPAAESAFRGQVPPDLLQAMHKEPGTWDQVFGSDADETFSAYTIARFVDQVASAGKAVYNLPMYANASLRDPEDPNARPGATYQSGGPSYNMIDVWKVAAKSLDILCPDIYLHGASSYMKTLQLYDRPDNALFVPETTNFPAYSRFLFAVIGMGGIGFSPFGIDYTSYTNYPLGADRISKDALFPLSEEYQLLCPMDEEIARLSYEGKVKTAVEYADTSVHTATLNFGKWVATVSYGLPQFGYGDNPPGNPSHDGCALVAEIGPNEFLVTGIDSRVRFSLSAAESGQSMQFLRVEQGEYVKDKWKFLRHWNGDQTDWGLNFKHDPAVLHVKLETF